MKIKLILIIVIFSFLSAVSSWANSTAAIKEPITSIVVKKSDRKMYLFSGEKVLRRMNMEEKDTMLMLESAELNCLGGNANE